MNAGIFDRDGHLTELGLDRLALEPDTLSADTCAAAETHREACDVCREALHALHVTDLAHPLPALRATIAPVIAAEPARVLAFRRPLTIIGGAIALAAAVLIAVRLVATAPDPERLQLKGDNVFTFNVYVHDGDNAVHASHAAFPVKPGDRMGFVVTSDEAGYLLIVGWDASGQHYGCFPQDGTAGANAGPGAGPETTAAGAVPIAATPSPWTVPSAMAFDDLPGRETVAAIFCAAPFSRADVVADPCQGEPVVGQDCTARCVSFQKGTPNPPTEEAP